MRQQLFLATQARRQRALTPRVNEDAMKDTLSPRHFARRYRAALLAGACLALLSAEAKAQSATPPAPDAAAKQAANAAPDTSGDFVETPIGAPAAASPAPGATAQAADQPAGATPAAAATATAPPPMAGGPFGFLSTASRSANLLGDMWGLRPVLAKYGMTLSIIENSEVLGNVTGGIAAQGFEYDGLTTATLQMDTQRAFGLNGGLFNASALQIHGGNLSADNLGTLQTASGIEADRATRLWELWYQQKFFDDKVDVKIGQQSLDQEFMVSQNAGYFVNTMFGWPMLPSADMPGGGPAYPLSALGVRARAHVDDNVTRAGRRLQRQPGRRTTPAIRKCAILPAPASRSTAACWRSPNCNSPIPAPGTLVQAGRSRSARAHLQDRRLVRQRELRRPALRQYRACRSPIPPATESPATHRGDYAFYAVADQMIYRFDDDPDRNINVFVRPMFTPLQDRNLISFSLNAGLTMHEPFFGRDDDTAGLGMGFTQVSNSATGLDQRHGRLQSRRLFAGPQQRDRSRGDLSISGHAVVADSARPSICLQSRRRHRQSEQSDPEDQERSWCSACAPTSPFECCGARRRSSRPRRTDDDGERHAERSTNWRRWRAWLRRGAVVLGAAPARARKRARRPAPSPDARLDHHRQWRSQPLRGRRRAGLVGQDPEGRRARRQFQQLVQPAGHRRHDHRLQSLDPTRRRCSPSCRRICRNAPAASA